MTNIEISDQILFRVINEGGDMNWKFFALKVMISRLKLKLVMSENKEEVMQQCYKELRELFHKSNNIPNAQYDMQIIIEKFGEKVEVEEGV